jgi:hypothetical protein
LITVAIWLVSLLVVALLVVPLAFVPPPPQAESIAAKASTATNNNPVLI